MMTTANRSPIPLIARLAGELEAADIQYCHWKSNTAIENVEQGEADLDLLVARRNVTRFNEVLSRCGFVNAERPHAFRVPGVTNFFGYDDVADRFVHVHAHYQLVLGHDRTKNYHLPIEDHYLASAETSRVLPIPSAEFEYLVLLIRMVLKYSVLDEILWNALRGRRTIPKPSEQEEFAQLRGMVDRAEMTSLIQEHLPFIGADLFAAAEDVAMGDESLRRRLAVARRVQVTLEAHARSNRRAAALLRVWRRVLLAIRRRSGGIPGYQLANGGAIIAIMGGDGAGKSTALARIGDWLEGDFDVSRVHLGKPPWSFTTITVRSILKVAYAGRSALGRRQRPSNSSATDDKNVPEIRRLLWFACTARDRYRTFRKARRAADRGTIVLADRYPHPALELMDVPQIARVTRGASRSRFVRALITAEERHHERIVPPEITVVLRLDPNEAARRKTDEPSDYVVERSSEVWNTDWAGTSAHIIDASETPEQVASRLKSLIWESLA
jgi:thymidylate kinase